MMMKSRYVTIHPLRKKSDDTKAFQKYWHNANRGGVDVKLLRSDNGGKYRNEEIKRFCKNKMIKQEFTVPHNPEQNGMAGRMNRNC